MDITANQLLFALDDYMKQNGGGSKYLASKLRKIFDNKDAPLNAETGPLQKLGTASTSFAKTLESLNKKIQKPLDDFKKSLTEMSKTFGSLSKYVASLKPVAAAAYPPNQPPANVPFDMVKFTDSLDKTLTKNILDMGVMLTNRFEQILKKTELKVTLLALSPLIISTIKDMFSKKEDILPPPLPANNNIPSVVNNYYQSINGSRTESVGNEEKGGLLGSIFKWVAIAIGGLFAAGYIADWLDKSETGKNVKKIIKTGITTVFEWIHGVITDPKNRERIGKGLNLIWRGLSFLWKNIYDHIIGPIWEEIKATNFGASKMALGATLKMIPKMFKTVSGVISLLTKVGGFVFKGLGKTLKFIPGVGTILSLAYMVDRLKAGDYFGAILEFAAGIAYFFPGPGTAIGIGIDVLNTFLDYKQSQPDNKGLGKSEIVVGLMEQAVEWFKGKFGVERLYQIPVIGPMMKIAKGLTMLSTDPSEGMKTVLKGIFAFNPITQIANAVSFIDFLMNGDVANDPNVGGSISNWFNSDIWIDKIGGFITGIVDIVTEKVGWIFGQIKSAMEWMFGKAESEMTSAEKEIESANRKSSHNRQQSYSQMYGIPSQPTVEVKPIEDGGITVIQPDSKDHSLFVKDGGPFDTFLKEMNTNFDEKLSLLVALSTDTINAILQSGGQVSQTILATAGAGKSSGGAPSYGNADPVRDFRNRAMIAIG